MHRALESQLFYNTAEQPGTAWKDATGVDVASDPAAAHRLQQLGISPRHDLPAVLLAEPDGKLRVVGLRLTADEAARLQASEGTSEGIGAGEVVVYSSS